MTRRIVHNFEKKAKMSNPRWRRKLALQVCAGALAAGAGYYGRDTSTFPLILSLSLSSLLPPTEMLCWDLT